MTTAPQQPPQRARARKRKWPWVFLVVVAIVIGWPVWLLLYTNGNLHHIDALVPGPDSPGVTYLIAGSDERPDGWNEDGVEGGRSDSTVLVHKAPNGQVSMVSLPRDTYVDIPGWGWNKLNAAFSFGGPQLLVETVQNMTGVTVDHFVQVNMDGVAQLVDAVGGVEMCLDMDVNEPHSGLVWEAGCRPVNGNNALALARMRYEDPRGDLGRAQRQRELMGAVASEAMSLGTLVNPVEQLKLSRAGTNTLSVDETMNIIDVAKLLLTFRSAGDLSGTPPLSTTSEMTEVGAVVLLDEELAPGFFQKMANGTLTPEDFETEF
ncbi:LCP family protein [Scrofimicrobium canadense]|uniref:LCP family protein n=1 Tax=Scrofimicrobium canadense TaxID=2652290 RepID=UPI00298EAB1D|nr:LCP family protein [Scrofimicrobium canadense]